MDINVSCVSRLSQLDIKTEMVGLSLQGTENQKHIGIFFYNSENDSTHHLHLCFHMDLRNDCCDDNGSFLCFDIKLDEWVKEYLADYCVDVAEKNQDGKIPYGFGFYDKYFDSSGNFIRLSSMDGLTCATFILAILDGCSLNSPILKDSWQQRESDKDWAKKIIEFLRRKASADFVEKQEKTIESIVRFRPEEVATAINQPIESWPLNFEDILPTSEQAAKELYSCNAKLAPS